MRLPSEGAVAFTLVLLLVSGPSVAAVPNTRVDMPQALTPHAGIFINGDSDLTPANGVVGGQGTAADPYVIAAWEIMTPSETGSEFLFVTNTNAHLVIENLYIHRNTTSLAGNTALGLTGVTNVRVTGIHTGAGLTGIEIRGSRNVTVSGSTFESGGVWLQESSLVDAETIHITADNLVGGGHLAFCQSQSGMEIQGSDVGQVIAVNCSNLRIADVAIRDVVAAVQLLYVRDATLENSTLSSVAWYGVYASSSTGLTILGNRISSANAQPVSSSGILIVESDEVQIALNTLSENVNGIWVGGGYPLMQGRITIVANRIVSNEIGALVNAVNGSVFHNDFIGNGVAAQTVSGSLIEWDAGYPAGGNYWSPGPTTDRCKGPAQDDCAGGDGIVDTPVMLTDGVTTLSLRDRYPLTQPYLAQDLPPGVPLGYFMATLVGLILATGAAIALGRLVVRGRRKPVGHVAGREENEKPGEATQSPSTEDERERR